MALSIILVNYKSAQLQIECLTEIFKDPVASSFEIIDVDNNSGDDGRERIIESFRQVKWVQMAYNSGFSRANNAGMRVATGDTILLLNGDTLPRGAVIDECYQRLRRSEYVACGVQLLNADGSHQISGNYAMKGGLNYLLPLPYLGSFVKWLGDRFRISKPHVAETVGTTEVDWINGAFLMVKKEAIDKAGMMDEDFFLYAEEPEWCARLKKTGGIALFGDLQVIHLQGAVSDSTLGPSGKGYFNLFDQRGRQIMVSNFVRIRKQFGVRWFLIQLVFYIFDIPVFFFALLLSGLAGEARYTWGQFRQFCRNVGVVIRKSPHILRNKPYFYKVI
jgi:GT2 family glycosyltransferase